MRKILFLLIFLLMVRDSIGNEKVLNQKKVPVFGKVNQQIQINLYPPVLYLHEIGHKVLYSQEFALLHIISNSPFTVYFFTKRPGGNIYKDSKYLLTYYIVLPYNSPPPLLNDKRWMDGAKFNNYYETPSDYSDYKRKIYVKALKNSPPFGKKEYEEEVEIRIIDINGNVYLTGFRIFYK
ncbi:MAG: hypothetical protein N2202_04190 [Proteobacteria bacterium]|nr:hypothetical protein [Pseudomonadota bacterium]